jgi:uncharacterized protein (TIGR03435 family)
MIQHSAHGMDRRGRLLLLAVVVLLSPTAAHAQLEHKGPKEAMALADSTPPYDVASVKQNKSADQSGNMTIHDDVFEATNMTLSSIIEFAYDVRSDQIIGLSGAVSSARFDIEAKVVPSNGSPMPTLTDSVLQAMIIPLLADRFNLKAHLQSKTMPVYDLVVDRGGPKFQLTQDDDQTNSTMNMRASNNDNILTAKDSSMSDLAAALSDEVHRQVIDKTGIKGGADFTLKWTSDEAADQGGTVVSIFTAVEEQLGLKLQPAKGPVDTLVIDHAEMPSAN